MAIVRITYVIVIGEETGRAIIWGRDALRKIAAAPSRDCGGYCGCSDVF